MGSLSGFRDSPPEIGLKQTDFRFRVPTRSVSLGEMKCESIRLLKVAASLLDLAQPIGTHIRITDQCDV